MRDEDNPFIKILKTIEILRKGKSIFDKEQKEIINNSRSRRTIELFQTLSFLAKKDEKTSMSLLLINNHLRLTDFLDEINKMVKIYKSKQNKGELMIYSCRVPETIEMIKSMIPDSGQPMTLFDQAFYESF